MGNNPTYNYAAYYGLSGALTSSTPLRVLLLSSNQAQGGACVVIFQGLVPERRHFDRLRVGHPPLAC